MGESYSVDAFHVVTVDGGIFFTALRAEPQVELGIVE
jgi:hypothetical protein